MLWCTCTWMYKYRTIDKNPALHECFKYWPKYLTVSRRSTRKTNWEWRHRAQVHPGSASWRHRCASRRRSNLQWLNKQQSTETSYVTTCCGWWRHRGRLRWWRWCWVCCWMRCSTRGSWAESTTTWLYSNTQITRIHSVYILVLYELLTMWVVKV